MEILSDATFKGNVSINGGDFSITRSGGSDPVILTGPCGSTGKVDINGCVNFYSDVYISKNAGISNLNVYCGARINGGAYIFGGTGTNINGDFSVTPNGKSDPLLKTSADGNSIGFNVNGTEFVSNLVVGDDAHIDGDTHVNGVAYLNNGAYITGSEFISEGLTVGAGASIRSGLWVGENTHIAGYVSVGGVISLCNQDISNWSDLITKNYISIPKPITYLSPAIPANCTAFEFVGCSCVSTDADNLIQVKKASDGKSVIAETWITSNHKPAMSFAGCTSEIPAGTYKAVVF